MPSRLFWFLVGGATATWWSTRHCDASNRPMCRNGPSDPPVWRSEENKERMHAFGDTVTEMSEASLDTVISAVTALKAKLAEHRAQRERLLAEQQRAGPSASGSPETSGKPQPPRYV